ncbi:MAG: hypothetical protein Alpg2KO_06240 [Alphaproteobacteria bacterium]
MSFMTGKAAFQNTAARPDPQEVIYELRQVGNLMRVTAMHAPTLTEVSLQGPASASESNLCRNAYNRLCWVMERRGNLGG